MDGVLVHNAAHTTASSTTLEFLNFGYQWDPVVNKLIAIWDELRVYDRALSDAEVWSLYDPQTRWDLYWQRRRTFFLPAAATGGGFQPAWARHATVTLGAGAGR